MTLQTPVSISSAPFTWTYNDQFLMLGSCFSDEIALRLQQHYFRVCSNPFGTLYNPLSIASALCMHTLPEPVEWDGLWHLMSHHGRFSFPSREQTLSAATESLSKMQSALHNASVLIITFGTAWAYYQSEQLVANCHKMPASRFTRSRLTVPQIVSAWDAIIRSMPDKQFVFTVSPIRHVKDGLHQNQLSKAILLQSIEILQDTFPNQVHYFPSYELMLDELRDYRFYADDLVHPSEQAVTYIWERFRDTYFTAATIQDAALCHQLWLDLHHTILHPDTPSAQLFLTHIQAQKRALQSRFPWIE